jgi:hypothetical protein
MRDTTDYTFPEGWGLYTPEQKHHWYVRERVFRQAVRQDTAFGRKARSGSSDESGVPLADAWKRAGRGGYRYDE